jgi:phytoene dehydrogenase-like protein
VDVTVVGSGPNGLAAAVICARAGLKVQVVEAQPTPGGGARTLPDPEFGAVSHDVCSANHPMALASPFFHAFGLAQRIELCTPEISYANPLPGRPAALAYRDIDATCAGLSDGASWRRLLGPFVDDPAGVVDFVLSDKRSVPAHPVTAFRVVLRMLEQGTPLWGMLRGEDARALLSGVAVHAVAPMPSVTTSALGMMLAILGHAGGWPVPIGGSQAIADALLHDFTSHGGELVLNEPVTSPPPGVVIYDLPARALLDIYCDALPPTYIKTLRRLRTGAGVTKVDFVLSDDIPWTDDRLSRTAMFHLGGTRGQMAHAEAEVAAGRHAEWPMILAATPHVADPNRVDAQGRRPFWTYAHVPHDSPRDQTETVLGIVERFAPGCRDVVLAARCVPAARLAEHNANLVGGDITGGGNSAWRALAGPTLRLNPWSTPIPKVYLCSAATPPNGGVHGMCGFYAARAVLKREFGITEMPALGPKLTP